MGTSRKSAVNCGTSILARGPAGRDARTTSVRPRKFEKIRLMFGRTSTLLLLLFLLIGCSDNEAAPTMSTGEQPAAAVGETTQIAVAPADTAEPTVPPTPTVTPSPTPIPLAATINGTPIYLSDYEAKLAQFREWYGDETFDGQPVETFTLDQLITQHLLETAAVELGIAIPSEVIDQAIVEAISDSGGDEGYQVWLETSGFTADSYRTQLEEEMVAQAVLNIVTQDVSTTDEFVRARYIQVDDAAAAETILLELANGADFATLVELYSIEPSKAVTKGDLGFFNRGTLLVPVVESVAFELNPFENSDILTVSRDDGSITYYIVQTTAREPFRALSAEQHAQRIQHHFEEWLQARRDSAEIMIALTFE